MKKDNNVNYKSISYLYSSLQYHFVGCLSELCNLNESKRNLYVLPC